MASIGWNCSPSVAPENTIISNELALDAWADFIENDIYFSMDGYLVIMHDAIADTTTYGTGAVESMTLAELQQLKMKQVEGANYPEARDATLAEQIDLARARGAMIYAEIKTSTPAAVDAFVALVKEKHAEDIINVMSFDANRRLNAEVKRAMVRLLAGAARKPVTEAERKVPAMAMEMEMAGILFPRHHPIRISGIIGLSNRSCSWHPKAS